MATAPRIPAGGHCGKEYPELRRLPAALSQLRARGSANACSPRRGGDAQGTLGGGFENITGSAFWIDLLTGNEVLQNILDGGGGHDDRPTVPTSANRIEEELQNGHFRLREQHSHINVTLGTNGALTRIRPGGDTPGDENFSHQECSRKPLG